MKNHYIYFILLPILLVIALMLPFQIYEYGNVREVRSGLDDRISTSIFMLPTLLATILLLVRNRVTAILGACIYLGVLVIAGFMNYVLNFEMLVDNVGPGPFFVLVVVLTGTILALIQCVRLVKQHKSRSKNHADLLDTDNF